MKRTMRIILCAILLVTFVTISVGFVSPVAVKGIKLDKNSVSIYVGQTYTMKVTFTPANTTSKLLICSTSDKNIAAVNADGVVTGVKAGKAVITVTSKSNKKAVAKLNVTVSKPKQITADLFTYYANFQGLQSGWFGKVIQDKFNMKVNLIGDQSKAEAIFQTRAASGNLGDLVILPKDHEHFEASVKAGIFMDLTDLLATNGQYYASTYPKQVADVKNYLNTNKIYGLEMQVSQQSPTTPMIDGTLPQYGSYMRLDYYTGIGSPKMNSVDDLLNVLQQMQKKYPKSDSGKQTYGFELFKDWDGNGIMQNAGLFGYMYGWPRFMNPCSTTFYNPETGATQSYLDDNGFYLKTLQMYFKANQMGLIDPDSPTQNWDTVWNKNVDGQALFSWWSWLGGAYNTDDHMTAGKGFSLIPISDEKIYNDGINPFGITPGTVISIGKKAKDPARLMDFINWMSTPDGFQTLWAGPEGLTWKMVNGEPVLTDFGKNANEKNKPVPAEYGGGNFRDGMWQTTTMILQYRGKEMNPVTKYPYDFRLWPSTLKDAKQLDKNWQTAFKASTVVDYLMAHKMFIIGLPTTFTVPTESSDVTTQRNEISNVVCNASWQMIFAKNQAEFNTLWQDMKKQAMGLGYAGLNALDKQYVKEWQKSDQEAKASLNK